MKVWRGAAARAELLERIERAEADEAYWRACEGENGPGYLACRARLRDLRRIYLLASMSRKDHPCTGSCHGC